MATVIVEERFAFSGGKVRRDGAYPVVEGVLLCGATSINRRRYTKAAFEGERVKRYNNRPVFLNHPPTPNSPRQYQDKIATIENARHRDDGMPIGDLAINPKHPYAEAFLFDAEHKPGSCGMSHRAEVKTNTGRDGWDEVVELIAAESVDIVVQPATTKGLFEGKQTMFTFKRLAEWVAKHPKSSTAQAMKAKRLAEMDDMADAPAMDAEPVADADPDEAITSGFRAAINALVDKCLSGDGDPKECLGKIKKLLSAHGDATDSGSKDSGDSDPPADDKKDEGKKLSLSGLIAEAKANGLVKPEASDLEILADIPTATARKRYCESMLARDKGEKPSSAGRNPGGGLGKGPDRKVEEQAPPIDGKAFAKRYAD